ncbi:hypothetical protein H0H87_003807 [Tephrocybe sp. NHM501043]|nr:hypothetical protein H0H87_003807 [Tephrocybe sp. NHM501043]
MLTDIHSESLAELLTQVHHELASPAPMNSRLLLSPGDIVEIQGGPSSGKTHLIYNLIIACVSPSLHGGWAKAAVVFDMDHNFDILRLNQLLIHHLTSSPGFRLDASSIESTAQQSLRNLHIFRPTSTGQLATTLSNLASYHSMHLGDREIGIVAIDSMSSHYWPDRFIGEQTRISAVSQPGSSHHATSLYRVLVALKSFARTQRSVVVMSNWGLHALNNGGSSSFYRQHLHPFPKLHPSSHLPEPGQSYGHSYPEHIPILTCHITLLQPDPDAHHELQGNALEAGQVKIAGLIRKPNMSSAVQFSLNISTEATIIG